VEPIRGWSREVTVRELAVSKTLAGVNMRLTAGGVRELHWHTADEWAIFLEMFKSSYYQDLSLSEWLSHTPPKLVMAHLGIDRPTLDAMPKEEVVVMPK
jgi:oxalate decarboxylase/phosphoglucose isomerase-like protein (cupin superfamily)